MDSKQSPERRIALLIDADNVSAKYIKPITDELSKYGTITIKRIYGDWTLTLHAKWKDALLDNSLTPIQQFGYTVGKNATDSAMIIDAMDILYGGSVDGFCIVSSDSDFTRLASRLRESGLLVIGMGEKKTPKPFRKACDIFTTLELLLGEASSRSSRNGSKAHRAQGQQQASSSDANEGPSKEEIEQAVVAIITDNQNNGKATGLGEVGSRLLKRYPDFDVRSYGTNQLAKLLDEFVSVEVTKDGNSVAVDLVSPNGTADTEEGDEPESPAVDAASEYRSEESDAAKQEGQASRRGSRNRRSRRRGSSSRSSQAQQTEQAQQAEADPASGSTEQPAAKLAEQDAEAPIEEPVAASGAKAAADAPTELKIGPDEPAGEEGRAQDGSSDFADLHEGQPAAASGDEASGEEAQEAPEESKPRRTRRRSRSRGRSQRKSSDAQVAEAGSDGEDKSAERSFAAAEASRVDAEPDKSFSSPSSEAGSRPSDAGKPGRSGQRSASRGSSHRANSDDTPERFIRREVLAAGAEGVALSTLGKRVRSRFRTFKVRDLGYTQLRSYVADLGDIRVEKRGRDYYALLAE